MLQDALEEATFLGTCPYYLKAYFRKGFKWMDAD